MPTLSWAEELERPNEVDKLLSPKQLREFMVNVDWSRSAYLSAPASTEQNSVESEVTGVAVNAIVYKVDDDYAFSDEEYAEMLRKLRSETTGN
jgi:hypothetical protein